MNMKQCSAAAKKLGLVRGKGTYNGGAYWMHKNGLLVSRNRLERMAYDAGLI